MTPERHQCDFERGYQRGADDLRARIEAAERERDELRAERDRLREALDNLSEVQIWSDGEDYMCLGCRSITGDADLIEHREDCRFMLARKALAPKEPR